MGIVAKLGPRVWAKVEIEDNKRISSQTLPDGVKAILDIPYLEDGAREHLLDIYIPDGCEKPMPLIIDIHGGGLMYGYKEINKNFCYHLARDGFIVISINYRLVPQVLYGDQVRDVLAAFRWIAQHGAEYGCDMDRVFVAGDSAGGQLCAHCTLINNRPKLRQIYRVEESGLDIRGVALICCMVNRKGKCAVINGAAFGKRYRKTPEYEGTDFKKYLSAAFFPPAYIVTSDQDFIQEGSVYMEQLLREKGIRHRFRNWGYNKQDPIAHVFNVGFPDREESVQTNHEITSYFQELSSEQAAETVHT